MDRQTDRQTDRQIDRKKKKEYVTSLEEQLKLLAEVSSYTYGQTV